MALTKKQERIISVFINLIVITTIFFPIRDQYAKRSMYYTTFALPTVCAFMLLLYVAVVGKVREEKSRFMQIYMGLLFLYLGALLFINFFYHHYYWELFHKMTGFLLLPLLWYKLPADFFKRYKIIELVLGIVIFSCICSIIVYYAGIDQIKFTKASLLPQIIHHGESAYLDKRLTFTYPHKSEYGVFLVLYSGLCLKFRKVFPKQVFFYGAMGIVLFTTYLTNSITAMGCVGLVVIGYILSGIDWKKIFQKYKIAILGIFAGIFGVIVFFCHYAAKKRDFASFGDRFPIWKASIATIMQNPAGIGMEFEKLTIWNQVNNCHNVFLIEALRFSIPVGILLLALFLVMAGKSFWKYSTFSAAVWVGLFGMLCMDYSLKEFNLPMLMLCLFFLFFMQEKEQEERSE